MIRRSCIHHEGNIRCLKTIRTRTGQETCRRHFMASFGKSRPITGRDKAHRINVKHRRSSPPQKQVKRKRGVEA